MKLFIYDKTLDGLLCCVFFAYEHKIQPDYIVADTAQRPLLMEACYSIKTDTAKSKRVWRRLEEKLSKIAQNMFLLVWLSELPEVEMLLFRYICKMVDHPKGFEMNFGDEDVVRVKEIAEKVAGESRQMIQFVRFQQTTDNVYFAPIAPRFNILSLIASHFEERYANQQWIVYDTKRNLGLYYDKLSVRYVSFSEEDFEGLRRGKVEKEKLSDEELFYQELWREYFKSTTIRERINLSLQRRHMPKRYWRYLTEIQ
ncbi:TIGR03915 family putative DNA repair protein [Porphyromonas circumdentaria]|uniref:Probable DNA metabolism protein n=1 Tax=Porphyromonas circumdentaria TaxID=29524 RepID=A0A1T4KX68_9PORP|nr:TIGR03915 family putative DNA repair protein [Porphyromonas circumdentaria]MBB6275116.1 putative DNA metabolism protein [Porphyromonas circumdentaria]MDO4722899.1 TIGR03915 family putative DNA repair protein [Porphyromonas circumdentaria]SJZ47045.1 probable DNA metabolism protein [Porphyromonas circumdentaria]